MFNYYSLHPNFRINYPHYYQIQEALLIIIEQTIIKIVNYYYQVFDFKAKILGLIREFAVKIISNLVLIIIMEYFEQIIIIFKANLIIIIKKVPFLIINQITTIKQIFKKVIFILTIIGLIIVKVVLIFKKVIIRVIMQIKDFIIIRVINQTISSFIGKVNLLIIFIIIMVIIVIIILLLDSSKTVAKITWRDFIPKIIVDFIMRITIIINFMKGYQHPIIIISQAIIIFRKDYWIFITIIILVTMDFAKDFLSFQPISNAIVAVIFIITDCYYFYYYYHQNFNQDFLINYFYYY